MSSEAVLAAAPKASRTEAVNERTAAANAVPKKKRVVARKPTPDDPRQNHAWSRNGDPFRQNYAWSRSGDPFGGGGSFGRF
jgi:hypothetical protein